MNNQDIIDSMDLEEFSSYPTIQVESISEIRDINDIVNDPNLPDDVYALGNYVRLYSRDREPLVGIFEIRKCLSFIGMINTERQFNPPETLQLHNQVTPMTIDTFDSPIYEPNSPDTLPFLESPPPLSVTTIEDDSPNSISSTGTLIGGKKKKSRKVKNKKKNKSKKKTRKGGSNKRLSIGITDGSGNKLFVPIKKGKKGSLEYIKDEDNIFASIRSHGVPPVYNPKWKDFDTKALNLNSEKVN